MIERLQRALEHLDELSPEAQQDLAQEIEDLTAPLDNLPDPHISPADATLPASVRAALALGGTWSDLLNEDEFAAFERIRHEGVPTPSVEDQLAWLDEAEQDH